MTTFPMQRGLIPLIGGELNYYLADIGQFSLLTPQEEYELAVRYRSGDKSAGNTLVEANLRLVVAIARRIKEKRAVHRLSLDDLIQEGNMGLMHAVEVFNPERGRFTTCATVWILQSIGRAIQEKSAPVHLPCHVIGTLGKVVRAEDGETLQVSELSARVGKAPCTIEHALVAREWLKCSSLDKPVMHHNHKGADESMTLGDLLASEDDLEAGVDQQELARLVEGALDRLEPRERLVLKMRYGLLDGRSRTLEEVGKELGVTRERIRQIERNAFGKLRMRRELQEVGA
jgi:RNA polymerase primary sigma factor